MPRLCGTTGRYETFAIIHRFSRRRLLPSKKKQKPGVSRYNVINRATTFLPDAIGRPHLEYLRHLIETIAYRGDQLEALQTRLLRYPTWSDRTSHSIRVPFIAATLVRYPSRDQFVTITMNNSSMCLSTLDSGGTPRNSFTS